MPIYGYRCEACGAEIEKRQGFHDDPLTTCDACGGVLRRVLHPVGIVFKGSGFYNTDNRKGGASTVGANGEGGKGSGDGDGGDASTSTKDGGESKKNTGESASSSGSSGSGESSTPAKTESSKSESSSSTPAATTKS